MPISGMLRSYLNTTTSRTTTTTKSFSTRCCQLHRHTISFIFTLTAWKSICPFHTLLESYGFHLPLSLPFILKSIMERVFYVGDSRKSTMLVRYKTFVPYCSIYCILQFYWSLKIIIK